MRRGQVILNRQGDLSLRGDILQHANKSRGLLTMAPWTACCVLLRE
jgi:hypothetical protein